MFHIRWQKLFNFATSNKVMEDSMTNVLPVVTEITKESRRYYFDVKKIQESSCSIIKFYSRYKTSHTRAKLQSCVSP